jgi:hypothetical protein
MSPKEHIMGHHQSDGKGTDHDSPTLSFSQKAHKLLDHWIHHNEDHAQSYYQWASEFRNHDFAEAAVLLEAAAELSAQINHALRQAAGQIPTSET